MPTPYVKKLAKEKGKSVAEVERLWDKAKEQAEKAGRKDDYAYITGILQHMVGASVQSTTKIAAKTRLMAKLDGRETQTLDLRIEATPEAMKTLVNLLAAIQHNTMVGHSCTIGAFFDGDGADKITVDGLPSNLGAEMAKACSEHGDGVLAMIGPDTALTYNARYEEHGGETIEILRKKSVYPEVIEHRLRGG